MDQVSPPVDPQHLHHSTPSSLYTDSPPYWADLSPESMVLQILNIFHLLGPGHHFTPTLLIVQTWCLLPHSPSSKTTNHYHCCCQSSPQENWPIPPPSLPPFPKERRDITGVIDQTPAENILNPQNLLMMYNSNKHHMFETFSITFPRTGDSIFFSYSNWTPSFLQRLFPQAFMT